MKEKEFFANGDYQDGNWEFYINGEAIDEHGVLRWPFQGSKKGDLCTAKSLKIYI